MNIIFNNTQKESGILPGIIDPMISNKAVQTINRWKHRTIGIVLTDLASSNKTASMRTVVTGCMVPLSC